MPEYAYVCKKCKKEFKDFNTISGRDEAECECGAAAKRDFELELKLSRSLEISAGDNERWSKSIGVPASQVEEFRKRFPKSVYNENGDLLIRNRKDKLRQCAERGFEELD